MLIEIQNINVLELMNLILYIAPYMVLCTKLDLGHTN